MSVFFQQQDKLINIRRCVSLFLTTKKNTLCLNPLIGFNDITGFCYFPVRPIPYPVHCINCKVAFHNFQFHGKQRQYAWWPNFASVNYGTTGCAKGLTWRQVITWTFVNKKLIGRSATSIAYKEWVMTKLLLKMQPAKQRVLFKPRRLRCVDSFDDIWNNQRIHQVSMSHL